MSDPTAEANVAAAQHERRKADPFVDAGLGARLRRIARGLNASPDSGAYKLAVLEAQRLSAPLLAVVLPVVVLLLLLRVDLVDESPREVRVDIVQAEADPAFDELPEPFETPPEFEPPSLADLVNVSPDLPLVSDPQPAPPAAPTPQSLTDVLVVRSPIMLRGLYSSRTDAGRAEGLRQHAGRHGQATEAAVRKALAWLRDHQLADGSWQGQGTATSKAAMTGLGLLTFLAHNETPASDEYGATVRRAIEFLISIQQPDGTFRHTEAGLRGGVYAHGIASYALSEAYALTRIPMILPAVERAVGHIVQGQRPDGGYDYHFARTGGHRDRCTSVAGWMAQAMKAAQMAGVDVEGLDEALSLAAQGFKAQYLDNGRFLYSSKSGSTYPSMTPVGTLCLQLLGHGRSGEVRGGLQAMSDWRPSWTDPDTRGILEPLYVWYYTTQALFHQGGAAWERWNDAFAPALTRNQNDDGSWTWEHGRSAAYGPVYATTLNALSLMVYYRYLPTYQTPEILDQPLVEDDDVPVDIVF